MFDITEIERKTKVFYIPGVSIDEINSAEKILGCEFSSEYKDYLAKFGALSFSSHEFTGLGVEGYLNVVTATKKERELDDSFPKDCILLENLGIEGILILQDKSGNVYSYVNKSKTKISNSFLEYLQSLLK